MPSLKIVNLSHLHSNCPKPQAKFSLNIFMKSISAPAEMKITRWKRTLAYFGSRSYVTEYRLHVVQKRWHYQISDSGSETATEFIASDKDENKGGKINSGCRVSRLAPLPDDVRDEEGQRDIRLVAHARSQTVFDQSESRLAWSSHLRTHVLGHLALLFSSVWH